MRKERATTLTLKQNAFTLSSASGVDSTFEIEATVKDQYQADYTVDKLSYKLASDPDTAYQDVTTNKFTISNPGLGNDKTKDASTGDTFAVNNLTSGKQMATGTYLVTATIGSGKDVKTFTKTFEVKNSQPAVTVSLKDTSVKSGTALKDNLKVVYDGNDSVKYTIVAVNGKAVDADYAINDVTNISTVKLQIELTAGTVYVEKEVTIGKTITLK